MARSTSRPAWGLAHNHACCDTPSRGFADDYVDRVMVNGRVFYITEVQEPYLGHRALLIYRADDGVEVRGYGYERRFRRDTHPACTSDLVQYERESK